VPALDLSQVRVTARPAKPDYPLLAQKAGIQGSVVVPILVGVEGIPLSARAVDGPGPLRRAAETFALAFRFEPYRVNGVPQAFRFTLTVTFTLRN
jgi:protein TonB